MPKMIPLLLDITVPVAAFVLGVFLERARNNTPRIVSTHEVLHARKNYYCDHCGELIEQGDRYKRIFASFNNKPIVKRVHDYNCHAGLD